MLNVMVITGDLCYSSKFVVKLSESDSYRSDSYMILCIPRFYGIACLLKQSSKAQ